MLLRDRPTNLRLAAALTFGGGKPRIREPVTGAVNCSANRAASRKKMDAVFKMRATARDE
ncbi:MAG: hypothetical protein IPM59_06860 [Chloracidobacterium sp.]|nr:hypothetical protein [Chloracidobacterium sp.]